MHFATRLTSAPCARVRSDPEVAPGWHRLLYLKAFTLAACSANKGQTCKSQINRATVGDNFDFATQVAEQFRTEQLERYQDHLATQLRAELPLAEEQRGALNEQLQLSSAVSREHKVRSHSTEMSAG